MIEAGRRLGGAVGLLDPHPERQEHLENLGPEGRPAGVGVRQARQAEIVLQGPEEHEIGQAVEDPPVQGQRFALQDELGHALADRQDAAVDETLDPGRVLDFDLDLRADLLPDPRRGEQDVRPDLAQVLLDRLHPLREVHREGLDQRPVDPELLLADPGKRQEGHVLEVVAGRVDLVLELGHPHHVASG